MSDTIRSAPRTQTRRCRYLNSLKGGVVPASAFPITVGRGVEIRALLTDLSLISDGGASFRFLVGRYGAGKSFCSRPSARTPWVGFVVADADLSLNARLQGRRGQGLATTVSSSAIYRPRRAPGGRRAQPDSRSLGRLVRGRR